ncbi:MAG: SUMF1/EgtB/PvdO family nonheme iron enzyme [Thermoanaerobaculia bacterium]
MNITPFGLSFPRLDAPDRDHLLAYYRQASSAYAWLFGALLDDDQALPAQPHPFRNKLAFYLGHTAAFAVQKLRQAGLLDSPVSIELDGALDRGVWPRSADDIAGAQAWPDGERLLRYRQKVTEVVGDVISGVPLEPPITQKSPLWGLLMGIEHEWIHFQTSVPLIRRIPLEQLSSPEGWRTAPIEWDSGLRARWLTIPGGALSWGRSPEPVTCFGWDNEFGRRDTRVEAFAVRSHAVTNEEYLAFVRAGSYERRDLWTSAESESWFETLQPKHPASWIAMGDGEFRYRSLFGEHELPLQWPVEVCRHEAVAFARWSGARLIREEEFRLLLSRDLDSPETPLDPERHNVALRYGSPTPVGMLPDARGESGVEILGSVSYWGHEDFASIPGTRLRPHALYEDFSHPWFRGDHGVLLGAPFSAGGHLLQVGLMRDFMQNHMDQIAGILLARSEYAL